MEQEYFGVSLEKLLTSGGQTLYMVAWSLIIGTIIGIILALILVLCRKGGLIENLILYNIVSIYINIVRSIPFVILLVAIMPLTRAIVGTTIGSTASLVPLVIYISPYLARLMENSLLEINPGILEAAEAMGGIYLADDSVFSASGNTWIYRTRIDNRYDRVAWSISNGWICRRRRCRRPGTDLWISEDEYTIDDFYCSCTGCICTDPSACRKYNFKKTQTT